MVMWRENVLDLYAKRSFFLYLWHELRHAAWKSLQFLPYDCLGIVVVNLPVMAYTDFWHNFTHIPLAKMSDIYVNDSFPLCSLIRINFCPTTSTFEEKVKHELLNIFLNLQTSGVYSLSAQMLRDRDLRERLIWRWHEIPHLFRFSRNWFGIVRTMECITFVRLWNYDVRGAWPLAVEKN